MSRYLILELELLEATGYERRADLEKHLVREGIWYGRGRGGQIYSTPAAFEAIVRQGPTHETMFDSAA